VFLSVEMKKSCIDAQLLCHYAKAVAPVFPNTDLVNKVIFLSVYELENNLITLANTIPEKKDSSA